MTEMTVRGDYVPPMFTTTEKAILVELLCSQQQVLLAMDDLAYQKDQYKALEKLKIKVKDV